MEKEFIEFSLVILANDHNPTILNPDFLQRNQIVNDEWGWQVIGQPITTPPFATVQYDSKVVVTVEPMKLQVTDNSGQSIEKNHICEIVSNYVNCLPHVDYLALGINFTNISKVENVNEYLIDRFLKDGSWNRNANKMQSVGFKFSYGLENGTIAFSIDKGSRKAVDKPFIVSRANFHRELDLREKPTSDQIKIFLGNIGSDRERFDQLYTEIMES